jgi:hypothetical protein
VPAAPAEKTVAAKCEQALMPGFHGFNGLKLVLYLLHGIITFTVAVIQVRQEILQFAEIPGHVLAPQEKQASEVQRERRETYSNGPGEGVTKPWREPLDLRTAGPRIRRARRSSSSL